MLSQLLRKFGLVRASRYDAAERQAKKLERRIAELLKAQDASRDDAKAWKGKVDEIAKALRQSEHEKRGLESQLMKLRAQVEKERARKHDEAERDRHREESEKQHVAELGALNERLVVAQRELAVARESLMAVEVKLDILEGAANVLDVRTRGVIARRDAPTDSAV